MCFFCCWGGQHCCLNLASFVNSGSTWDTCNSALAVECVPFNSTLILNMRADDHPPTDPASRYCKVQAR